MEKYFCPLGVRSNFRVTIPFCRADYWALAQACPVMTMEALMEKLRAKADSQKTLADTSKIVRILVLVMNSGSSKCNPSL